MNVVGRQRGYQEFSVKVVFASDNSKVAQPCRLHVLRNLEPASA